MEWRNVSFTYDSGIEVFRRFSLEFPEGEITAILGPSGCGKTTLLHLIAGLLIPSDGSIGRDTGEAVSYLFQEPRLLPWMTVLENVCLVNKDEGAVRRFLEIVGLRSSASRYPGELSGGMRQRVAMARAFAFDASMLLMDEPFQALDLALRLSLVNAFRHIWGQEPRTSIFVTHDIQEALVLGDRIFVLDGPPVELVGRFVNPVDRNQRSIHDPRLLALEAELYHLLIDERSRRKENNDDYTVSE
ncbi:ABC transporter ATP-binding protein [Sediminispirochaeta smaragdinae]|uniref:ABC transporter related protein n=1 Tax=Sediminispirochaeta smaragdinae (strain DSM 11293 / JCM 15392 / SEBR 4228) TaxID=573413 RepID=E1R5C0_SEDSS|nr:ABC transporter ATP-binding protein [Sediminispirochaeta smaragdinae]ADK82248.1 ABC transporter related protein [Sediminispirochaeta smaragdinae DSM 11293]